jgi:intracellular sulfur oxidation DsrE/DsrF family protein
LHLEQVQLAKDISRSTDWLPYEPNWRQHADGRRRLPNQVINDFETEYLNGGGQMISTAKLMVVATAAALVAVTPASAQEIRQVSTPIFKRHSVAKERHRLILQVNSNDPAMMNLALNNATNVVQYYKGLGEKVSVEVITFGPGLHMLREDTSPVKARIETLALSTPEILFKACGNTLENMRKAESKDIPLIPQAKLVSSGVVRVMQLQEQGWSYVKP